MPEKLSPKDVALGFFADINAGKFEKAFARLSPDVVYDVVSPEPFGGVMNREGLGHFVETNIIPRLDGPMEIAVLGAVAEGDRVAIETRIHAKGKGGNDYNNRFHCLMVVREDVIVEVREYMDSAAFLRFVAPHVYHRGADLGDSKISYEPIP